jgi:hypothetical protein
MLPSTFSLGDRVKILEKANYSCVKCGEKQKRLYAHSVNGDHSDWHNGEALCQKCHSKEHKEHLIVRNSGRSSIYVKMSDELREYVDSSARDAGLNSAQFIRRLLIREIKGG